MSNETDQPQPIGSGEDVRSLAASLVPQLIDATGGRLGEIAWFRTDWQRGGAATGMATFGSDDGRAENVVVKLPVRQRELTWIRRLQSDDHLNHVAPRLLAGDDKLDGYDLAWLIIERFAHGPLGTHWHDGHIGRIAEAAAQFATRSQRYPIDKEKKQEDWDALLDEAKKNLRENAIPDKKRWAEAIKAFCKQSDTLMTQWRARQPIEWLHGDLHPANAMSRDSMTDGPVALIDLAEVHPGHWVEDAVYLERQLWSRPERLKPDKPLRTIAKARKAAGLKNSRDYPQLAFIRRAFLAATAPAFIRSEGSPTHINACLKQLETALGQL